MGRGNQIIRSFGGNEVRTFYLDFHSDIEDVRKILVESEREQILEEIRGKSFAERREILEDLISDGSYPITISDERCYDEQGSEEIDGIDNVAWVLNDVEGFDKLDLYEHHEELVAGNRECGTVIAKSDNCIVVVADNESCTAIGCVPTFTMEEIDAEFDVDDYRDSAEADLIQTRKRADAQYEITDVDIDEEAEAQRYDAADNEFDRRNELYKQEANLAMAKVHALFGTQSIYERSCAWTSHRLPAYEEIDEEERKTYYY